MIREISRGAYLLGVLIAVGGVQATEPPDDPARKLTATLAVQTALRSGIDLLNAGKAEQAIAVLEAQLPHIDGNPKYLAALRDSYCAFLRSAPPGERTELIRKRLAMLDPQAERAIMSPSLASVPVPASMPQSAASAAVPASMPQLAPAPTTAAGGTVAAPIPAKSPLPAEPLPVDPFQQQPTDNGVSRAEAAFAKQDYATAGQLYASADAIRPLSEMEKARWAYCELVAAEAELAQAQPNAARIQQLVQAAVNRAPRLEGEGRKILAALAARPSAVQTATAAPPSGWQVHESANFRVMHRNQPDLACQVANSAEQLRTAFSERWAGPTSPWSAKCEVYLHATGQDYQQATRQPVGWNGHATIQSQGNAITARRLDFPADDPELLTGPLAREMTHLALADIFAGQSLPRWAEVGLGILAEPPAQVGRYIRTAMRCQQNHEDIPLGDLLKMPAPDAAHVTAFYAESVVLAKFLVERKGPREFAMFLQYAPRYGYDVALKRYYDISGVAGLSQELNRLSGLALRN